MNFLCKIIQVCYVSFILLIMISIYFITFLILLPLISLEYCKAKDFGLGFYRRK